MHDYIVQKPIEVFLFRKLPEGASDLRFIEFDKLSSRTKKNLEILKSKFSIEWTDVLTYDIGNRHGFIIKGKINKQIEYWRVESQSRAAGQTILYCGEYFVDYRRYRATELLNKNNYTYKSFLDWNENE